MKRIAVVVLAVMMCGISYAEVTYTKVDDMRMKATQVTEVVISRGDLLARKAALEKALADINLAIAEADKLGVTKTESLIDG